VIKLPKKNYTPKPDVQIGKEAASEVRKQYASQSDEEVATACTAELERRSRDVAEGRVQTTSWDEIASRRPLCRCSRFE
jgi:hypothetical protein